MNDLLLGSMRSRPILVRAIAQRTVGNCLASADDCWEARPALDKSSIRFIKLDSIDTPTVLAKRNRGILGSKTRR